MLSLAFHPSETILGWSLSPLNLRVEELRASDVHSKRWKSLAIRFLQGEASLYCGSIASLQAAVMILLDSQEESLELDAILVTAISGAQKLGLHRLGSARLVIPTPRPPFDDDFSSSLEPLPYIRIEVGVRVW